MRIRWTPAAAADLEHLSIYLREHHPNYREPTMGKLYEGIRSLKQWPNAAAWDARTEPASYCFHHCRTLRCTA